MKKIIFFISLIFMFASTTKAQTNDWRGGYEELFDDQEGVTANGKFWNTNDCNNFNLIQAGYRSDTSADGFFVGYKHGWNITAKRLPLYLESGLEFNYTSARRWETFGLTVPIDFSYKFKIGDFSISPITGPTLGWIHDKYNYWYGETDDDFVFGWDFGGRVAYKNFTLSYRYNKVLNDCSSWSSHSIGIGFTF